MRGAKEKTQKTYRDAEACVFTPSGFPKKQNMQRTGTVKKTKKALT